MNKSSMMSKPRDRDGGMMGGRPPAKRDGDRKSWGGGGRENHERDTRRFTHGKITCLLNHKFLSWDIVPIATTTTSEEVPAALAQVARTNASIGDILSKSLGRKLLDRLNTVAAKADAAEKHLHAISIYCQAVEDILDEIQEDAEMLFRGQCGEGWITYMQDCLREAFVNILAEIENRRL